MSFQYRAISLRPTDVLHLIGLLEMDHSPRSLRLKRRMEKPKRHRFDDVPDTVIDEYRNGATLLDLAKKYDHNAHKIRFKLIAAGVKMRPKGYRKGGVTKARKLSPEQVDYVLAQDLQNVPYATIARHVGVSRERVRQICAMASHEKRLARLTLHQSRLETIAARKRERVAWLIKLSKAWKRGLPTPEMAILLGLKTPIAARVASSIGSLRKHHGVAMFPYRRPNHWKLKTVSPS